MNRAHWWLLFTLSLMAIFLVFLLLCALSAIGQEVLFFKDWEVKKAGIRPDGLLEAILINPDPKAGIKSVVVLVSPPDNVIAYWYFQDGEPKVFALKGDKYVPDLETQKNCQRCHNHKV